MEALPDKVRVLILSPCRLLRETLEARLRAEDALELTGSAESLHAFVDDSKARTAHVLLIHADEDTASAPETVTDARALLPFARIVVLLSERSLPDAVACVEAGAAVCVEQSAPYPALVEAIAEASKGRSTGSLRMVACVLRRMRELDAPRQTIGHKLPQQPLSDRETEVAGLVSQGLANKQIAIRLHISTKTVKSHVHKVLHKLQLRRRRDVMRRGRWAKSA